MGEYVIDAVVVDTFYTINTGSFRWNVYVAFKKLIIPSHTLTKPVFPPVTSTELIKPTNSLSLFTTGLPLSPNRAGNYSQ